MKSPDLQWRKQSSRNKSPRLGYNYMVHRTNNFPQQEKLGKRGFGTIYKGILNELKSYNPVKISMVVFRNRNKQRKVVIDILRSTGLQMFSNKDLVHATDNFSEKNILEEEEFCTSYKGFLKELDLYISIKRRGSDSDQQMKEYAHRVMIFSRLRHRNLVELTEFMPYSSLNYHLFFREDNLLTWELRYKIVQDLASGLLYLQEGDLCVVHGDIKPENVVLDTNFNAKLGGFDPAKSMDYFVTDQVLGTADHLAPECFHTGRCIRESDVYSFGLVALNIACGTRPSDSSSYRYNMVNWV
ncbi:L-type lectin-domain containing receptor kinase IX.1-like [Euphorbia lathyris]|uniref:L-type lectin-domain containing receptor kinase IX.1-like n=1 Tax=Euphorbia lathyris TaxID=212925 RepID=UPI003313B964